MVADWLRWFGPDGLILPTGSERAEQEASRADREAARAEDALRRLAEIERRHGKP
jgi:hypothetical protein